MQDVSFLSLIGRLALSLAVVLVLMVLLARVVRGRMGPAMAKSRTTRQRLEVIGRQGLSRNASLALLRVDDRTLLVGVTESAVSLLTELDGVSDETGEGQWTPTPGTSPTGGVGSPTWRDAMERLRERTVRRS